MIQFQAGLKRGLFERPCLTELNNRFNNHVLLNITFKFNNDIILIYFLFDSMYKKIVVQIKRTACSYNQRCEKLQL